MSRCPGWIPIGRREVRDIILELKAKGRTVFFSTHVLSDAEMLCDRVAVLAGGKLQGIGSPAEIVSIEVHGMEILCDIAAGRQLPADLAAHAVRSGTVIEFRCRRRNFTVFWTNCGIAKRGFCRFRRYGRRWKTTSSGW